MSMSMGVIGSVPADDKWKEMKAVYEACQEAGVNLPEEVVEFFGEGCEEPCEMNGMEVEIPYKEWTDGEAKQGIEIEVKKIPKNVKKIRFYNSF